MASDKASLDLFWLKDSSLTDLDNLPDPDVLVEEIIENLEAGLESLRSVLAGLRKVGNRRERRQGSFRNHSAFPRARTKFIMLAARVTKQGYQWAGQGDRNR